MTRLKEETFQICQSIDLVMKSYFDPVLGKNIINKGTRETFASNLRLQDESIVLYDNYEKISSLHLYTYSSPTTINSY